MQILSNFPGFSADTEDFSLRVNISMAEISGSFLCSVDIPQCLLSLSSPDDIDKCMKLELRGKLQKVHPNYCELACVLLCMSCCSVCLLRRMLYSFSFLLLSLLISSPTVSLLDAQSLNTTSTVEEGIPISLSCITNTTGFHDNIIFAWAIGGIQLISCSDNDSSFTIINGENKSVLTYLTDRAIQFNFSCGVHATDYIGGCIEAIKRFTLTVIGERFASISMRYHNYVHVLGGWGGYRLRGLLQ